MVEVKYIFFGCSKPGIKIIFRFRQFYVADEESLFKNLPVYRHIQLIANLCNEIQQKILIPTIIAGATISVGVSTAILVHTSINLTNLPLILSISMICVNAALVLLFCLGGMADVYKESILIFRQVKARVFGATGRKNKKLTETFVKSCSILKIKFGGNNFVEALTPLNCLSHGMQLAVQILLI